MPTGGEALVAGLVELGVDVAFGLPGVHNLDAWKAFPGSGVRLVGVRHEQAAGYAADGYARSSGRLGVALTTTGPGAANIVAATGEAWASHSPILVIATDIPLTARVPGVFSGVLHETTDQASFFRPVTKAQVRVEDAADVHDVIVRAGRLALMHPRRPVYVEIPTDLLSAQVVPPTPEAQIPPYLPVLDDRIPFPRPFERPLVWAGGGATAANSGPLVEQLCTRLGAPLLTSYGGKGLLPPDHPLLVPLPPHAAEAGALWDAADLVIVVGSDMDAMNTQGFRQPRPPWVVTVDLSHPVNLEPDVHIPLGAVEGLTLLLEALPAENRTPWFDRPVGRSIYAGSETEFLDAFESGLTDDTVVVADMCIPGYWFGGFGRVARPRGLAYPVGWGTLGFGFPAALGAALAGRPAVALVGDGGFLFACGELATAAQEQIPLTTVLVDDGGYGMLAYDFTRHGDAPVGCDLEPPDFVALAQAFRVEAREVTVADLGAAIAAGIASGRPSLLVVKASFTPPVNTSPRWYRAGS